MASLSAFHGDGRFRCPATPAAAAGDETPFARREREFAGVDDIVRQPRAQATILKRNAILRRFELERIAFHNAGESAAVQRAGAREVEL
jgi:hypothetical protein